MGKCTLKICNDKAEHEDVCDLGDGKGDPGGSMAPPLYLDNQACVNYLNTKRHNDL